MSRSQIIVFAFNAKSFAIAIILFLLLLLVKFGTFVKLDESEKEQKIETPKQDGG